MKLFVLKYSSNILQVIMRLYLDILWRVLPIVQLEDVPQSRSNMNLTSSLYCTGNMNRDRVVMGSSVGNPTGHTEDR